MDKREKLITIKAGVQLVPDDVSARLLDKQIEAMVWMDGNLFANAMRTRLRAHLKRIHRNNVVPLNG